MPGTCSPTSLSLALAWYAFHLAERSATARLTYGFDRVKTLVAYTNGLAIFAIALWIIYEAWQRFLEPTPILGWPMLLVAIGGLAVNIAGFAVLHGGDRGSLNMRGAILHVLGDMLGSAGAIVAALVILASGWTPIDPLLSVLVALLILYTAWSLTRDAAHVLLEGAPPQLDRDGIASDLVAHVANVREVHHIHVWSLDGSKTMATLHACLDDGADANVAVRAVKARLSSKFSITHATVEPEFGRCADAEICASTLTRERGTHGGRLERKCDGGSPPDGQGRSQRGNRRSNAYLADSAWRHSTCRRS